MIVYHCMFMCVSVCASEFDYVCFCCVTLFFEFEALFVYVNVYPFECGCVCVYIILCENGCFWVFL